MSLYNPNTLLSNPKLEAKITTQEDHDIIKDDDTLQASVASSFDMTGFTPTVAHNEYESESYGEVLPHIVPIPEPPGVPTSDAPVWGELRPRQ